MKVTKEILLDTDETNIIESALSIIDEVSERSGKSMDEVFQYLIEESDIKGMRAYDFNGKFEIDMM